MTALFLLLLVALKNLETLELEYNLTTYLYSIVLVQIKTVPLHCNAW